MINRNDYDDETLDIPDFVEDKTGTDSSIDMSIFKMSDEELYDDPQESDDDFEELRPKKKNSLRTTVIICLIIIVILLATTVGSLIYGLKQHSNYVKVNTENVELRANLDSYKNQLDEKDRTIEALSEQLNNKQTTPEPSNVPSGQGTLVYEITNGPLTFRKVNTSDGEAITYKGKEKAQNGEKYNVLEVVNDRDLGDKLKWAKLEENVYFLIEDNGNIYAKKS